MAKPTRYDKRWPQVVKKPNIITHSLTATMYGLRSKQKTQAWMNWTVRLLLMMILLFFTKPIMIIKEQLPIDFKRCIGFFHIHNIHYTTSGWNSCVHGDVLTRERDYYMQCPKRCSLAHQFWDNSSFANSDGHNTRPTQFRSYNNRVIVIK